MCKVDRYNTCKMWGKGIDATKEAACIPYWFATLLLLEEGRRYCEGRMWKSFKNRI